MLICIFITSTQANSILRKEEGVKIGGSRVNCLTFDNDKCGDFSIIDRNCIRILERLGDGEQGNEGRCR